MRQLSRPLTLALFAAASTALPALMSIDLAPRSRRRMTRTTHALMMGGTGMPTPSSEWMDSIISEYIDPATGGHYAPVVVTTPEALPVDYPSPPV